MIECSIGPRQISGLSPGLSSPTEITFRPWTSKRLNAILGQHPRLRAGTQHQRNVGAVNVGVEQSGLVAHLGQRQRQIDGQRGLAHASLARTDGNYGVNSGQRLRPRRRLSGTRRHLCAQEITLEEESSLDYTGIGCVVAQLRMKHPQIGCVGAGALTCPTTEDRIEAHKRIDSRSRIIDTT